ncbi:unnamed protein product [Brassica oleracea var. botrytis]
MILKRMKRIDRWLSEIRRGCKSITEKYHSSFHIF